MPFSRASRISNIEGKVQKSASPRPLVLVGCGSIVEFAHAPALAEIPGFRVTGLVDPNPDRSLHAARLMGLDPEQVARPTSIDHIPMDDATVALVATPSGVRREIVADVLRRAGTVVVEKPLAASSAEARTLLDLARTRGRRLIPVHQWLFDPAVRALLTACSSKRIGRPLRLRYVHHMTSPFQGAWPADPLWRTHVTGGCLADLGYHAVYLIEQALGSMTGSSLHEAHWRGGVLWAAIMRLTVENGLVAEVDVSWTAPRPHFEIQIVGTDGVATVGDDGVLTVTIQGTAESEHHPAGFVGAYRALYRQVLVETGLPPAYDRAETAIRTVRLLERTIANSQAATAAATGGEEAHQ